MALRRGNVYRDAIMSQNKLQQAAWIICTTVFFLLSAFSGYAYAKTVRVGISRNPLIAFKDDDGQVKGLSVDVLNYIAGQEGWQLQYLQSSFAESLKKLQREETDLHAAIAYSKARAKKYDYTKETLFHNWTQVYVPTGANVRSILDLNGKRVALVRKGIHSSEFRKLIIGLGIDCKLIEADDNRAAFALMNNGQADAVVASRTWGALHLKHYNTEKTPIIFNPIEIRYAVLKGKNQDLLSAIDKHLALLKADKGSIYYHSTAEMFGAEETPHFPLWMKLIMPALLAVLLLSFLVIILFRRQVRQRTTQLSEELSERKLAEEALRKSEEKYHHLFDNANDAILIIKPVTQQIINVNQMAVEQLGYSRDEFLELQIPGISPYADPDENAELIKRIMSGEKVLFERDHKRKDGTTIPVEIKAQLVDYEGEKVIMALSRDITERKEAEREKEKLLEQLLQSQKMEAIGNLTGGVAHDFNNILSAIVAYGSLMKMDIHEGKTSEEHIDGILSAAERAAQLTKSLLAFSRKQVVKPKNICLNTALDELKHLLFRLVEEDIKLNFVTSPYKPVILIDEGQFHQMLINLTINAKDAMPKGGVLTIESDVATVGEQEAMAKGLDNAGLYAMVRVSDTGVGMDKNIADKVFEPFFTTKEVGKGTGLGLSTVYGIVKQNSGSIEVSSEPGRGSVFTIYLPVTDFEEVDKGPAKVHEIPGGNETILLAEDEQQVRASTADILSKYGYTVIEAVDGHDAVLKYTEHAGGIELLILDVVMPVQSGKNAFEKIQAMDPDVKVIFTSGYTKDIIDQRGVVDKGLAFIEKPANPIELLETIRKVLDGK